MTNRKLKVVEIPKLVVNNIANSNAHELRKILDALLKDYPEGVKLSTLRTISEKLFGFTLHNAYIVSNLMGYEYYIDCKSRVIFKG